ncbi:MAG: hypothetical protein ABR589_06640 [Chthoniobacterales bacterium]
MGGRTQAPAVRLAGGVLLLSFFKLWLVHGEDIYGSATWFDALWYLRSARSWYWGEPYSWAAFIRPAAYPLWIALVHAAGISLRFAAEVLYLSGYVVLIIALRRAGASVALCLTIYALAILHPASFIMNGYTMADTFYGAVLPLVVGGLILTLLTRRKLHTLWTGIVLAVLWNTREESVLVLCIFAAFAALAFMRARSAGENWLRVIPPVAVMCGVAAALIFALYAANARTFGSYARSAMSAPSFVSAYKALLSIRPAEVKRFVPVTRATRRLAYEASPSFAKLRPHLEGEVGRRWEVNTFQSYGIPEEISAGLMVWALRNAADAAGQHASPGKAERFYKRMTREIDRATRDGKVPRRPVWAGPLDPAAMRWLPYVPQSFARMSGFFFAVYQPLARHDDPILTAEERSLYSEMTGRRGDGAEKPARLQRALGAAHPYFVIGLSPAAAFLLVARRVRGARISLADPRTVAMTLLLVTIVSRLTLFAVLDATSWSCQQLRYIFPVLPLYSALLLLAVWRPWRRTELNTSELSAIPALVHPDETHSGSARAKG